MCGRGRGGTVWVVSFFVREFPVALCAYLCLSFDGKLGPKSLRTEFVLF